MKLPMLLSWALLILWTSVLGQTEEEKPIQISAYLETYYAYQDVNPGNHELPSFLYSHNRHNEITPNLALIQLDYALNRTRAKVGLMAGTYANTNLIAEPQTLKNIFEANVGYRLSTAHDLWVDAGVFASHIGFESAIGANCWTLSRSLAAENSPYYNSGVRLSYTSENQRLYLAALVMNGWQRIRRPANVQLMSFGHQLTYTFGERFSLNSSSFIGMDQPERMRYFHNLYAQIGLSEKLGLLVGFDIGAEQADPGSDIYYGWYSPVAILRYELTDRLRLALRGEYFYDPEMVIVNVFAQNGFQTSSASLNLDYQLSPRLLWRVEGRWFQNLEPIFAVGSSRTTNIVYTSLAFSL
ncbi:MAG: porin [Bacteroidota bacterium]